MAQIILNGLTTLQLKELFCEVLKEHLQLPSKKQASGIDTPFEVVDHSKLLTRAETAQIGYYGSNGASHFGGMMPVISVQMMPF